MFVLHSDCRKLLPTFPAALGDVAVADPPYGDTSLEWGRCVGGWVDAVALALKPNGVLWVFGSLRFLAPLFAELEKHGFKYSQDIVWEKQNGTGFHNDRFRRVHEHAAMFYRGAWAGVYRNPQYTLDATKKTVRRKTRPTHTGHIEAGHYVSEDGGPRLMRSVQYVRNEHGRAIHPTQKPVELLRSILRYSTPPGGFVIDPFSGSASVGEAAKLEGFRYLGFEIDATYAEAGNARLAALP